MKICWFLSVLTRRLAAYMDDDTKVYNLTKDIWLFLTAYAFVRPLAKVENLTEDTLVLSSLIKQ